MESILLVFLSSFLLTVNSHPRNSDLIPKDYYKRQILQPIPGYIPVYIKTDGEPIIRSEKIKHDSNAQLTKVFDAEETKSSAKYGEPKGASPESDKISTEPHVKKSKSESPNFPDTFQSKVYSSDEKEKKLTQTKGKKI